MKEIDIELSGRSQVSHLVFVQGGRSLGRNVVVGGGYCSAAQVCRTISSR